VEKPVELISFHIPMPKLINSPPPPGCPPHTYESRFFRDLTYVADSGGLWRYGSPFDRPGFKEGTGIHLLTHPIWWDRETPETGPEISLEKFAKERISQLHAGMAREFRVYREYLQTKFEGNR
jgi:hypothetical protein